MGGFFEPQTKKVSREPEDVTEFRTGTLQPFTSGIINQPFNPQTNPFAQFLGTPQPESRALQASLAPLGQLLGMQLGGFFGSQMQGGGGAGGPMPQPQSQPGVPQGGARRSPPDQQDRTDSERGLVFRQFGGRVDEDQPAVVGEQGPEMFVPDRPGTVVPNPQTQAQMGMQPPDTIVSGTNPPISGGNPPATDIGSAQGVAPGGGSVPPVSDIGSAQGAAPAAVGGGLAGLPGMFLGGLGNVMGQIGDVQGRVGNLAGRASGLAAQAPGMAQAAVEANQPVFQENLSNALGEFQSSVPSNLNTAAAVGSQDLTRRALQDFNAFQAQQRSQALNQALRGQQIGLSALGQAGQLGLGAGRLGLGGAETALSGTLGALGALGNLAGAAGGARRAQQSQFINPTLQLMMGANRLGAPIPADVAATESPFGSIVRAGGTAAGLALAGSSVKFKENITPLEKIRNLNLYEYNYRGSDRRRLGAIIEDPTTPDEWKRGDMIDLYEMMSTLTAAVQELAEKVDG